MPTFLILCHDKPGTAALRAETRPRHLEHLGAIGGRVVRAGPLLDEAGAPTGSLILAEFDDIAAARDWAARDPYAEAGLFAETLVAAWRQVIP